MGSHALGDPDGDQGRALKVRAFFGLPLPDAHRQALQGYVAAASAAVPEFSWTPPENLHLTIRFLGHVEDALAEGIADRVEQARPEGFDLALGTIGSFKRGRLARVVWLGLAAGEAPLAALARLVEAESIHAGLKPENRKFHGHLTLARARPRDGAALPELAAPPSPGPWRAEELILYRSHLGRGGSVYEPLWVVKLR